MAKKLLLVFVFLIIRTALGQVEKKEANSSGNRLDSTEQRGLNRIDMAKATGDIKTQINEYIQLSEYFHRERCFTRSIDVINQGLDLAKKNDIKSLIAKASLIKGINLYEQTKLTEAIPLFLEAKTIFEQTDDYASLATMNHRLGEFYRKLGSLEDALTEIETGLSLYKSKSLKDTVLLINLINRKAAILNQMDHLRESVKDSYHALELCEKIDNSKLKSVSFTELGYSYFNMNMLDSGIFCYNKAIDFAKEAKDPITEIHAMYNLGLLYSRNGYPKDIPIKIYREIIERVQKENLNYELFNVYLLLSLDLEHIGQIRESYDYRIRYYDERLNYETKLNALKNAEIVEKYKAELLQHEKNNILAELEHSKVDLLIQKQRIIIILILVVIGFSTVGFVSILLFRIRKQNQKLALQNKQKVSLVREIHHRVKNNLQFISSLINFTKNNSENKNEIEVLNETGRRITAMSLVHEMLQHESEKQGVFINTYLAQLIQLQREFIDLNHPAIEIKIEIQELYFDITKATALGIITSECISNSVKHAFNNVANPQILIKLKNEDKQIHFIIEDNGSGIVHDKVKSESMGLVLIDVFVRQLGGEYRIEEENGYKFILKFDYIEC